jgi:tropinone reductase I
MTVSANLEYQWELYENAVLRGEKMNKWQLKGKTALISGGTKGIGLAIAEEILNLGGSVYIVARDDSLIQERIEKWEQKGFDADGSVCDITSLIDMEELVRKVENKWKSLDILINNAGTNIRKKIHEYSPEEYDSILSTNMNSSFHLCRLFYEQLKKSGNASVVNILSVAGLTHLRTGAPYGMTKAALNQMTRNLACDWAEDKIRVNALAPWYTRTPLAEQVLKDKEYLDSVLSRTPMGRIAEANEIATAAAFLCMEAASYITGQCIAVDGGFSVYGF